MAVPKYHTFIDFDKDCDFRCINEDVTNDVRTNTVFSFKVDRTVNLRKHRVEASSLELFLNNEDHLYSPFFPDSLLNDPESNTSVFPAPNIWMMAGYPVDDFGCATGNLTCRSPSHDSNFTWTGNTGQYEPDNGCLCVLTTGQVSDCCALIGWTLLAFSDCNCDQLNADASRTTCAARSGSASLKLNLSFADGSGGVQAQQCFTARPGQVWSAESYVNGCTYCCARGELLIEFWDACKNNNLAFHLDSNADTCGAWHKLTVECVTAPANTAVATIINRLASLSGGALSSKAFFDDTYANIGSLRARSNAIKNPGYEKVTLRPTSGIPGSTAAIIDTGEPCGYWGAKFTRNGTSAGLVLRHSDNCNYVLVHPDGCKLKLSKIVCGTASVIDQNCFCWCSGDEHWILAQMHGSTYYVSVDNTLVINTSELCNCDGFNSCVTNHGLGGETVSNCDRWSCVGGWKSLFFGRIDTISPRPEQNNQYTYIRAFDDMERQNIHQVFRSSPCAPATAKDIMREIFCAVCLPTCKQILDCGETLTHNCQHRKSIGRDALTELYQVQCDDVGLYYMDGSGYARYEGSCHRASAPHVTSRATWHTDRQCGNECDKYIGQRFEWDDGKERVENDVWYFYNKISEVSCGVEVWRLNDTSAILDDRPALNNGETFTTLAIGCGDVVACPITPVACTDFTVHTDKCGVGTNLSACICASITCGFEGNFRLVNLTNNSGCNGFVTFLRLRATKHTASAKAGARAENTTSQTENGRRRIQHCSLHIDEFDTALDRAQKRVSLRARSKERLLVDMENGTKGNLMEVIHRNISDKVSVCFSSLCITNAFHIEGQTLTGRSGGLYLNSTWTLQEAFGGGWGFNRWQCCAANQDAFRWA